MRLTKIWSLTLFSLAALTACDDEEAVNGTGKAKIYVTDAPIDDADVSSVIISVISVEARGPEGWETVEEFEEPVVIDLLSYQNGSAFLLGDQEITAGTYSEVRLKLDIQQETEGRVQNPGCYMEYADGSIEPLFVPGGAQSGYKVNGDFTIPEDGEVNVTLDFDVRKAIVKAGNSGNFILKPTVRLIANQEAGTIEGTFDGEVNYNKLVVFAYADGEFEESETGAPAEGEVRFSNAITSAVVTDKAFTLAFMNAGTYDLYFAAFDENGEFTELLGSQDNVDVEAGASVEVSVDLSLLN